MEIEDRLVNWIGKLCRELDARASGIKKLREYATGDHPVPEDVTTAELEAEYRELMRQAITNWPELIVKSVAQRLDVAGFRFASDGLSGEAWGHWQRNKMDQRSRLIYDSVLTTGRAYVTVWNDPETGRPTAWPEDPLSTVVAYDTRGNAVAALRRWREGRQSFCTLYLPGEIFKFKTSGDTGGYPDARGWVKRPVEGEAWPLTSAMKRIPVVEYAVNRTLSTSEFGSGCGEFERVTPVIDRINTTIFSGLLAQTYSAFPVRALIGEKIRYEPKLDSDGNAVTGPDGKPVMEAQRPFNIAANRIVQIESKDGKFIQLPEAQLDNYIKFAETHIRHLAAITQTPAHYLLGEMVNLSADAIRAAEAGLISKIHAHQIDLGESHEEVVRLLLLVDNPSRTDVPDDFETRWADAESRSLAERADAAVKLASLGLPWQVIGEKVLGMSDQEIKQANANAGSDALNALIARGGTEAEPIAA